MTTAVEVHITGRVQGVGFRWSTAQQAQQVGVTGWVRNQPDGSVAAWFEGDEDPVDQMVDWCQQGPRWARVDQVIATHVSAKGYGSFEVR